MSDNFSIVHVGSASAQTPEDLKRQNENVIATMRQAVIKAHDPTGPYVYGVALLLTNDGRMEILAYGDAPSMLTGLEAARNSIAGQFMASMSEQAQGAGPKITDAPPTGSAN